MFLGTLGTIGAIGAVKGAIDLTKNLL